MRPEGVSPMHWCPFSVKLPLALACAGEKKNSPPRISLKGRVLAGGTG